MKSESKDNEGKLFKLQEILDEFDSLIEWQGKNNAQPVPKKGISKNYDIARNKVNSIKVFKIFDVLYK